MKLIGRRSEMKDWQLQCLTDKTVRECRGSGSFVSAAASK